MQIHGAMLALHTNRPVKIVYNREESFFGHVHRHPARIWCEHRATRAGELVAVQMKILLDGGAYASSSTAVTSNAACFALGPYRVDNALIESTCVYTNNPPCGAMRGFGAVQTCFAAEAQMDKLAAAARDRSRRAAAPERARPGRHAADRTADRRLAARRRGDPARGRAPAARAGGAPARGDPPPRRRGQHDARRGRPARRRLRGRLQEHLLLRGVRRLHAPRASILRADGSAEIHCASAEVGQGVTDVILQVARTELGTDDVALAPPGTAAVGSAGSASASRMTWMAAGAVQLACRAALEERERKSGGRGRRRARLPARAHDAARSRDGADHRRARPRLVRGRGDARRRGGGRRARADAGRLDRHRPGRRQGDQPARRRGSDRGRHGAGSRPRADGGDPGRATA